MDYNNITVDNLLKKANAMYTDDPEITSEMKEFFNKRTKRHIDLVKKYCKKVFDEFGEEFEGIIERGESHDESKFKDPEIEPYVLITWDYKCKDEGKDSGFNEEQLDYMNTASEHHVNGNAHHPEFHVKTKIDLDREDRYAIPKEVIDATGMGDLDIAEMCCDWAAMSEEKGESTPMDWAKKNIGERWDFDDGQVDLIYEILDRIWR